MIIKKTESSENYFVFKFKQKGKIISKFFKKNVKKISVIVIFLIFGFGISIGLLFGGFFGTIDNPTPTAENIIKKIGFNADTRDVIKGILAENINIPSNYIKGLLSTPDTIYIDINFENYQKLAYKREKSLELGVLISDDEDYVPATIRYNDQTIDVKLRLKGDLVDHINGDKWSFRIKVKGDDTFKGMKIFSIQDPKTRNYIYEWLFQKSIENEEIISLRYEFIDVFINGKHKGIYALEEHFSKELIENNQYREGPIIRFDESLMWTNVFITNTSFDIFHVSVIDSFQTKNIMNDSEKYEQYIKAKNLLESFRRGMLKTEEVFDTDKLAKFMAISEVLGGQHAQLWHNSRFYYNPITSKLEPILYDGGGGNKIDKILLLSNLDKKILLKDTVFFKNMYKN